MLLVLPARRLGDPLDQRQPFGHLPRHVRLGGGHALAQLLHPGGVVSVQPAPVKRYRPTVSSGNAARQQSMPGSTRVIDTSRGSGYPGPW